MNYMNKRISFGDVRLGPIAKKNMDDVFKSNWPAGGPKVKEFEIKWGELFNYKYNASMSSGTDAVMNACMTLYDLGAKRGDYIIVPALSFIATSNAVLAAGFTPMFVDIDHTMNIDPELVKEKLEDYADKIRAIIVVSTMGCPPKMKELRALADKYNKVLICDNAEGHGCQYDGKYMGEWADMSTYSFYAAHVVCCGEGGIVSTNQKQFYDILISTRSHGRQNGDLFFDHVRFGLNSKMNDMEAAIGLEGLENFWETYNKRLYNLEYLVRNTSRLQEYAFFNYLESKGRNCGHAFSITIDPNKCNFTRDQLIGFLESKGIQTKINFGCIPTQQKSFSLYKRSGVFPKAEFFGKYGIHIGCHQYLTDDDLDYIINNLENFFIR